MASMLIYWSSVKAVKAILILVSFIISIFGVNSKINILHENVNAFVTLHGISGNKVNARTQHARTLKQKN